MQTMKKHVFDIVEDSIAKIPLLSTVHRDSPLIVCSADRTLSTFKLDVVKDRLSSCLNISKRQPSFTLNSKRSRASCDEITD